MTNYENQNFFKKGTVFKILNGNLVVSGMFRYKLKNIYANGEYVTYNLEVVNSKDNISSNGISKYSNIVRVKAINTTYGEKIELIFNLYAYTYPKNK